MKRCLIIVIILFNLFNKVYGQSPSAAIDSLIQYGIITVKERAALDSGLKDKSDPSYKVKILGGLESVLLQKTFHVDLHKGSFSISYGHESLNKKSQDSVNTSLRSLLEGIKKAGLLTDRVYAYILKGIDSGRFVVNIQMVGSLTEMSARLESLAPDRLLPVAKQLHKNGIVSDSSFRRLENDINNGKIEYAFQLNDYCRLDRVFDLTKYADDPDVWLEQIHRDIASMLPGLSFTDFTYTTIPDTSFTIPGVRFKVSLICNGHSYKYTSLPFDTFKRGQGTIHPSDIYVEDFYRIFNKVLVDQQSPFRLHSIMFSSGETGDDNFRHFALIALNEEQMEAFMKPSVYSYMTVSMDNYDGTLTSARVDSVIAGWRSLGLFAHLSSAQIGKAIDNAEADDWFQIDYLLRNFQSVIYPLDSAVMNQQAQPYGDLLSHLAKITHGIFNPTKIIQNELNGGVKLEYFSNGKIHSYIFRTANGWLDAGFPPFMKRLSAENDLPGDFYLLQDGDGIIYLTKQQYEDAVKYKLLDFGGSAAKTH